MPLIRGMIVYIYALADSEGGEGDVRPPPLKNQKIPNKHKKINGEERKQREREERFSLFASNYHNNLQVYLNLPASYVP